MKNKILALMLSAFVLATSSVSTFTIGSNEQNIVAAGSITTNGPGTIDPPPIS